MDTYKILLKNYNWRMLLMRILVNMLALFFTVNLTPKIYIISSSLLVWVLLAIGLGLVTAIVKPIIQFMTLRFIFITGGLVVILINTLILYILGVLAPNHFHVSGILWALVGGLILGITSTLLENLLGLTPPIISEHYPDIRQQVKDRQFYRTRFELARIEALRNGSAIKSPLPSADSVATPAKEMPEVRVSNSSDSETGADPANSF